ncbi:LacI family DNA-binding transcriptional regulator [Rhodoferax sp.]|uniref:LacI family DNA-binding transcriptional regulator n=1 Tax=Rhodoferax sp. TaxID=50421 RepID=UPI0025DAB12F|nr:LacI family DNA-binding transcriptional regulator [Rhodoferax sp.]
MNDVARAARVSVSTVSHVINGTRRVDTETEQAVRLAIQSVGYIPNSLARSLARSATSTIGVAISTFSNHYFTDIVRAMDAECEKAGLMMLFSDTHDDPEQELRVIQAFHQRRVDGIVLAPTNDGQLRSLHYLEANHIPTVLVDHLLPSAFDQVGVENAQAIQLLVKHLIGHGHRRIGFVAGAAWNSTTDERLAGYRLALQAAALPFDPSLVVCGESSIEPARLATHQLLALAQRPTAIVASNNLMTLGTMRALREADIQIPQHMAFGGMDDFDWADLFTPPLTVAAQPLEAIGTAAMRQLIERIKDPEGTRRVQRLPVALHIRKSCGCTGSPA